ncbi:hypothetical protein BTN50_0204 [Candidatus Enterovibrio altilux]|uniref:Uncharacterized protein n=1 Tax=Candidatus Enterovibrio altilux TaxID=1927128 RepID=A0A291B6V8_9GAMM|nr:hypothetical protein BTN50_0204 [Candidatus Enterovibrio luxaltus]
MFPKSGNLIINIRSKLLGHLNIQVSGINLATEQPTESSII